MKISSPLFITLLDLKQQSCCFPVEKFHWGLTQILSDAIYDFFCFFFIYNNLIFFESLQNNLLEFKHTVNHFYLPYLLKFHHQFIQLLIRPPNKRSALKFLGLIFLLNCLQILLRSYF